MMHELSSRLKSVYAQGGVVTPNRVQQAMEGKGDKNMSVEELYNLMPPEIQDSFLSNKGNLKEKKKRKFLRNLNSLMAVYSPMDLLKISEECINNDGQILENKLKEILGGEGKI